MITESQLIAAGAKRLSKILLSLYTNNPNLQKQLDIIFTGLDENPKKLITVIKKEITSLKRSTGFVDYYASDPLADRLQVLPRPSRCREILPPRATRTGELVAGTLHGGTS